MSDVPLPPFLRRIQQTWLWQVIGLPLVFGFGSAIIVDGCLGRGIQNLEAGCIWGAANATLVSFLTVIVSGHSVGSSSFASDGRPIYSAPVIKAQVDEAIEVAKEDSMTGKK